MYFSPKGIRIFSGSIVLLTLLEIFIRIINYDLYFASNSIYIWMFEHSPVKILSIHYLWGQLGMWVIVFLQITLLCFAVYSIFRKEQHPRLALFVSALLFYSLLGFHGSGANAGDVILYTSLLFASIIQPYSTLSYGIGVLQAAILYLSSAIHKNLPMWAEGKAVYYVLANDTFATSFGKIFTYFPFICVILTYFTILVLYLAWVGFLIPYKKYLLRKIGFILLFLLHFGLLLTLHIHLIGPIMLAFISLFWIYNDHDTTISHKKWSEHLQLFVGAILLFYILTAQALFNFGFLSEDYRNRYPFLKTFDFHLSVSGYKVGYNFFSLDVSKNEWFEIYEPTTGKDLLRGRTLEAGQFTRPASYYDSVVNARLHRLLYSNTKYNEKVQDVANYYCLHINIKDIIISKYSQDIFYPKNFFYSTKKLTQPTKKIIYSNECYKTQ